MVVPAILAVLLLISVIGGLQPHLRRWLQRRRHHAVEDRIRLAFPLENPGPRKEPRVPRVPGERTSDFPRAGDRPAATAEPRARAEHPWDFGGFFRDLEQDGFSRETAVHASGEGRAVTPSGSFRATIDEKPAGESSTRAIPAHAGDEAPAAVMAADAVFELDLDGDVQSDLNTSLEAVEAAPAVDGRSIRFHLADTRTMRLLPGRLEVEEGEDERAEIRFVDIPGMRAEVTFGRRSGEPLRHIQLRSPTVSRNHARMRREGRDWVITNLSRTNPIVVNGATLAAADQEHTLQDGDRIEMGDVVFRYRGV